MFNSVEHVRSICKNRHIPISRLEKECGCGNGYLNPKKQKAISYERAVSIAEYLGVSVEYVMTGEESKPENKPSEQEIRAAFFEGAEDLPQEDLDALWDDARDYIQYKIQQRRHKND